MARIGNSMSHLVLALSQTLQSPGVDPSVQALSEASLRAFAYMSRELGRVWLAQSPLSEPSRKVLHSLPIVPGQLFRPAVQQALERSFRVTQIRQQFAVSWLTKGNSEVLMILWACIMAQAYVVLMSAEHSSIRQFYHIGLLTDDRCCSPTINLKLNVLSFNSHCCIVEALHGMVQDPRGGTNLLPSTGNPQILAVPFRRGPGSSHHLGLCRGNICQTQQGGRRHCGLPHTVGSHTLVTRFLKGTQRLRPPQRSQTPSWDLPLVLEVLCQHPFETLENIEDKWVY
ncbi:hypothetical protein N1851_006426 [Merluccius polli]|uniref:Uncharacterized protein n=1 Tax=Merluccius polli TaxID=89951 RepID=A0AA47N5F4_MERPO|nr:hypothetical protein N1851_006426 [Merluccius polli]